MAMGERTPVALLSPAASVRLAIGEAVTNIAAAAIDELREIRLSANWMAASGHPGEDQALLEGVEAASALCRELGIAIPVGKDSLSMRTRWQSDGRDMTVFSPLSLIVTAFAPARDIRRTLTPQLRTDVASELYLFDLGNGANRLGGNSLSDLLVFGKRAGEHAASFAKANGAVAIDDACSAALGFGVPTYRFVRRYLERQPTAPLSLRQVDPLIRQLTQYRDLIDRIT